MSAFVVDKAHIDFLVQAALAGGTDSVGWSGPHDGFSWWHGGRRHMVVSHVDIEDGRHSETVGPHVLGQRLLDENLRSVRDRYPDLDREGPDLPGPRDEYWRMPYVFEPVLEGSCVSLATMRQVLPAVSSTAVVGVQLSHYEYQSCEHEGWRESEACAFVQAMRERLLHCLPGAADASWGFVRSREDRLRVDARAPAAQAAWPSQPHIDLHGEACHGLD